MPTASFLTCWNSPTVALRTTKEMRFSAAEGAKVLLHVPNQAEDLQSFHWYKGKEENKEFTIAYYKKTADIVELGKKISGKEEIYKDGSMMVQNVTKQDTGFYTLVFETHDQEDITHVSLQVHKIVTKPSIQVNSSRVNRREAWTLTCGSPDAGVDIHWFFNYKPVNFTQRFTLSPENRRLTIAPVRRADAGIYQCEVSNAFSSRKSNPLLLVMAYG